MRLDSYIVLRLCLGAFLLCYADTTVGCCGVRITAADLLQDFKSIHHASDSRLPNQPFLNAWLIRGRTNCSVMWNERYGSLVAEGGTEKMSNIGSDCALLLSSVDPGGSFARIPEEPCRLIPTTQESRFGS